MKPPKFLIKGLEADPSLIVLLLFGTLGTIFAVCFGIRQHGARANLLALSLMTAAAASFAGGLVGFLFGVPHTRDSEGNPSDKQQAEHIAGSESTVSPRNQYKPNTSLEQISDWLSKIIVGVGLVEIKSLTAKLWAASHLLAVGFESHSGVQAFFTTLIVYFSICGFLFGFLWARMHLRRLFMAADQDTVRRLNEEVSEIKSQLNSDARAFGLISAQLARGDDEPAASDAEILKAVRGASVPVKVQMFNMAERASRDKSDPEYALRNKTAASVFRALAEVDAKHLFHRNHSELSYVLKRRSPPDFTGALQAIDKAIEIRNRLEKKGWLYYELSRALYRIKLDDDFKAGKPSRSEAAPEIRKDLEIAASDAEKWKRWRKENPEVDTWLTRNDVSLPR